ncbi:MAG: amidase [Oscillospiraceae bacterium]|nr:amidase [Oscillospiraceae bacterium]
MKRHLALILAILLIVPALSSCAGRPAEEAAAPEPALPEFRYVGEGSASRQLEDLFTTIDLLDATIAELTAEMEAGHVTSAELTRMYLDRIAAYDDELNLNSITNINPNALEDAAALDRERAARNIRGPLHGIPVIVKDNIDVAGMATTAGSAAFAGNIAQEDAFVIKRLREAGAVILAKANMSEFARRTVDSHSTFGGNVHNAYDPAKTSGGSSGGTAVAVTCSFAAAGLGTDTGGSIRYPSAFANLYGLRPSKGLTSTDGVFPLTATNDTVGPMTRTAEDLAVLLEVIAGTDEKDDYTLEVDADALKGDGYLDNCRADGLQGMRIGILTNSFTYHPNEEFQTQLQEYLDQTGLSEEEVVVYTPGENVRDMVNRARENLIKAGATIVDISEELSDEMVESLYEDMELPSTSVYDMDAYLSGRPDAAYASIRELADSGNPEASDSVIYSYMDTFFPADEEEETAQGAESGEEDAEEDAEEPESPYSYVTEDGYARPPYWETYLDTRETVQKILEENDVDAVMYLEFFNVPPDDATAEEDISMNYAGYTVLYPIYMGFPEIMIPMGFSEATEEYPTEFPMGLSIFAGFGKDDTLVQIAFAYQQQAGSLIRRMPESTPALRDEKLNGFLEALMEAAYSIDTSGFSGALAGKAGMMETALRKAADADMNDPYAVYEAAAALARAYDRLLEELETR